MKKTRKEAIAKALNEIPETARIGPWKFQILLADSAQNDSEDTAWGECDFNRHWITIYDCPSMPSCRMLAGTVLHEILHAVWRTQNLPPEIEEDVVSRLETGILSLACDNPKLWKWLLTTIRMQHDD